jgi:ABC-type uncharacterized transport system permease subunit
MIVMTLSGALAGMVAFNQVLGVQNRLVLDFVADAGFVGIAVALMGRNHPIGVGSPRCCSARSTRAATSCNSSFRG